MDTIDLMTEIDINPSELNAELLEGICLGIARDLETQLVYEWQNEYPDEDWGYSWGADGEGVILSILGEDGEPEYLISACAETEVGGDTHIWLTMTRYDDESELPMPEGLPTEYVFRADLPNPYHRD